MIFLYVCADRQGKKSLGLCPYVPPLPSKPHPTVPSLLSSPTTAHLSPPCFILSIFHNSVTHILFMLNSKHKTLKVLLRGRRSPGYKKAAGCTSQSLRAAYKWGDELEERAGDREAFLGVDGKGCVHTLALAGTVGAGFLCLQWSEHCRVTAWSLSSKAFATRKTSEPLLAPEKGEGQGHGEG